MAAFSTMCWPGAWPALPVTEGPAVEVLGLRNGERSTRGGQPWQTLLVVVAGAISLDRADCSDPDYQVATVMLAIPAGVDWALVAHETPTRVVLIAQG